MELNIFSGPVISIILLIIGIASCFYGNKIFKFLLVVLGFFAGAYLFGSIGAELTGDTNIILAASIAGGIILGLLVLFFYYTGIFFAGVLLIILLSSYFNINYRNTEHLIILLIVCAIGGVLALIFHELILTIATAIIGGWFITNSIGYFFYSIKYKSLTPPIYFRYLKNDMSIFYIVLLFTLLLSILGMVHQFKLSNDEE